VPGGGVATALRHEVEHAGRMVEEPLRREAVRLLPQRLVVVVPEQVQQHEGARGDLVAVPAHVASRPRPHERRERVEAAYFVRERQRPRVVVLVQAAAVLGPPVQRMRAEREEPGDRDRGSQHVEHLHRDQPCVEQLAVLVAMVQHPFEHRTGRRRAAADTHSQHDALQPPFGPPARGAAAGMPRTGRPEPVDHPHHVASGRRCARLGQRDARPRRSGAQDDLRRGVEQRHLRLLRPPCHRCVPLRLDLADQRPHLARLAQREEHSLAPAVRGPVHRMHRPLTGQGVPHRLG